MRNLLARILTAIFLLPIVLAAFINGGILLLILLSLVSVLCAVEITNIILPNNFTAKLLSGLFFLGIFVPCVVLNNQAQIISVLSSTLFAFNLYILFSKEDKPELLEKFSTIFFLCFYVYLGLACVYWLQTGQAISPTLGRSFILIACVATWINDSFAYFGGNLFGKHPLFKTVSQKKTWEGFISGTLFTIIFGLILIYFNIFQEVSTYDILFITLPVIILGPLGDLIESRIKRLYQVKDASKILPGHGGLFDRIDSLLVVIPWAALYAFFIRPLV